MTGKSRLAMLNAICLQPPQRRLSAIGLPAGRFCVRVDRAPYRRHKQKPDYQIRCAVLKPQRWLGCLLTAAGIVPQVARLRRRP
jgi:hypothetical protein